MSEVPRGTLEIVARAMVATQGHGHNDPPFYEDYEPERQAMQRREANILIGYLAELGYEVVNRALAQPVT